MQLIRLLATFTAVLLGAHLLSSCGAKTSPKSPGGNEGPSGQSGPTSVIELSGSIADEAPVDFVQSSASVTVGQVNLTDATSYVVKAYSLDPSGSKKEIFTGSFAEPNFSFKSTVARQYMLIEITRLPDGGQYGAVLPPPTSNKQASLVVDGATTIAAKMAALIASKAESGDQGAQQALTSGSVSVADLLMVAQSVRTTVIEQKEQNIGSAIDLSSLAANLISKSNELVAKLSAEGQSGAAVAEKLSEASYQTIFGDDGKVASAGILAYRVNPDLGSSDAAKTTIAYEAIKASSSDSMKPVDEAFRAESTAYRAATSVAAAVTAKTQVASDFKAVFSSCVSLPASCAQTSYTPAQPRVSDLLQVKAPGLPRFVAATAGYREVSLTWRPPLTNGGALITDYVVQYSSDSGSNWITFSDGISNSPNVTVTGLTNGTAYLFRVAATNSAGAGGYGAINSSVTPQLPPWSDVTLEGQGPSMRDNNTGLWWSRLHSHSLVRDAANSYCEGLSYNGQSDWRLPTTEELLAAHNNQISLQVRVNWIGTFRDSFWSSWSKIVNLANGEINNLRSDFPARVVCVRSSVTTPDAPTAVTAAAGDKQVVLTWAARSPGVAPITDYVVQYKAASAGEESWITFNDGISNSLSATVTGLTNVTPYVFRVAATNSEGTGSYSEISSIVKPPGWSAVTLTNQITMRDNLTGLWWSNDRGPTGGCASLIYNGQADWRIPTHEELIAASDNLISSQGRVDWITDFNRYFQSASPFPSNTNYNWIINLANGEGQWGSLNSPVVCVRP